MKYLYFTAGWCGPCNMLGPIMEKVKNTGIPVQKIDVDTANPLIAEMGPLIAEMGLEMFLLLY
jgi:thiol-disulfide isomerase/thioredoxin